MADILTRIQDELDMLLHQMQASLTYIKTRAPPAAIPGQPLLSSFAEHEAQAQSQSISNSSQPSQTTTVATPLPPSQEEFQRDIREVSRDLLPKEQQIEILIGSSPGLNASGKEQIERMKDLEQQLEEIEGERLAAVKEKEALVKMVEDKICSIGGVR